jgi:hypothetical protein
MLKALLALDEQAPRDDRSCLGLNSAIRCDRISGIGAGCRARRKRFAPRAYYNITARSTYFARHIQTAAEVLEVTIAGDIVAEGAVSQIDIS